VNSYNIHW